MLEKMQIIKKKKKAILPLTKPEIVKQDMHNLTQPCKTTEENLLQLGQYQNCRKSDRGNAFDIVFDKPHGVRPKLSERPKTSKRRQIDNKMKAADKRKTMSS